MVNLIYMVAGMSSRFGNKPKQMAIIGPNNETLIEYSVNQALQSNFTRLIFITNSKTEYLFRDIFKDSYRNVPVEYVEQKYDKTKRIRPWGTCDAICSIIPIITESFIMVNGDDIYGVEAFKKGYNLLKTNNIIGGLKVIDTLPEEGEVNRGILFTDNNKVVGMKEMLKISKINNPELYDELANVNFMGLQPQILLELNKILEDFKNKHKDDEKIECILTDNLDELIKANKLEMKYFEIPFTVGEPNKILGITNPGDEIILRELLSKLY